MENGVRVAKFLGLLPLTSADARTILNDLWYFLEKVCKLDMSRLVGFGSDGASVMRGVNNGVAKLLADKLNSHLISIHCIAHVVALSSKHGSHSSCRAVF